MQRASVPGARNVWSGSRGPRSAENYSRTAQNANWITMARHAPGAFGRGSASAARRRLADLRRGRLPCPCLRARLPARRGPDFRSSALPVRVLPRLDAGARYPPLRAGQRELLRPRQLGDALRARRVPRQRRRGARRRHHPSRDRLCRAGEARARRLRRRAPHDLAHRQPGPGGLRGGGEALPAASLARRDQRRRLRGMGRARAAPREIPGAGGVRASRAHRGPAGRQRAGAVRGAAAARQAAGFRAQAEQLLPPAAERRVQGRGADRQAVLARFSRPADVGLEPAAPGLERRRARRPRADRRGARMAARFGRAPARVRRQRRALLRLVGLQRVIEPQSQRWGSRAVAEWLHLEKPKEDRHRHGGDRRDQPGAAAAAQRLLGAGMRSAGEAKLRRRVGALLRRRVGAALRFRRIEGFPRQHLFHTDPCLQRRGGARLRFGALGGEHLAPALGLDTRLQRGGRFRFRFFTSPRGLDRILGRLGPRQGAATQLVVERHALARALQRRRLRRGGVLGLAAQRFLHGDARLQLRGGRRFSAGPLLRLRLAALLGGHALAQRHLGARFGLVAFAEQRRPVRFLARALLGGVARVGLCRLALARRLDRGRFRCRERLRALVQAVFRLGALPRGGGEGLLRRDARLRFGERARLDFLALARRVREVCLGLQPLLSTAAQLGVHRLALAREARRVGLDVGAHVGRVLGRLLRRRLQLRRLERLGLGIRALARLLLGRKLQAAALLGQRRRALLRRAARVRLFQRAHFGCLALLRRFAGRRLGIGTRLRAPRGMRVLGLALAHRRHGVALGGDPFLGGDARLLLGIGARTCELRGIRFQPAALVGQLPGPLLGIAPRLLLLEVRALDVAPLLGQATRFGLRRGARLGLALELVLGRLALSCRVERPLLGLQTLARLAPRQFLGRRALAHRRGRLDLRLGSLARVLRGFFLLLAAALGQRRGFFLRFLARFRLGGRLRFGALALGDHARRLRLGLGARIGDAPQLDFRRLALARQIQPALLLAQLCLRRLAGAALGLDAVALHSGAHAVRLLQLVEQLAHLLALALALSAAAVLRRAGEKSRLIMSPSASE